MISSMTALQRKLAAGAIVLFAVHAAPVVAATPCIDTNSLSSAVRRTMTVQQPGGGEIAVTGTLASLNPATGQVGLRALGIEGEQQIQPSVIRLATQEPNMAAQMPIPVKTPLGSISADFPFSNVTIDQGIIRYPGCVTPEGGHETAFNGTLTFGEGRLKMEGMFFDYTPPVGGGGSGPVLNKRG